MGRKLTPGRLVVASHNPGKAREISELFEAAEAYEFVIISAADLDLPEPEETEKTFAGNARLKARAAAAASGLPALADDSGLEVAALSGAPGVYSARWAGPGKDFALAMARVERELRERAAADFSARFVCALSVAWPDGHDETVEGEVRGTLTFPPRGGRGFGYDPIFVADGETETFGEMDPAKKLAMSHRAEAFRRLRKACLD
jgi:XTP/dITP diphosphohydrolase